MIKLVLENNNFVFNGKEYQQVDGTAIGSKLGKNYACTYMGEWEKQLLENAEKTPCAYWRFVDDIIGLWTHGEENLLKFHRDANAIHPRVQVTLRFSTEETEFLDTTINIRNGQITTSLYEKPTDRHMYIHGKSDHPPSSKIAIPYGLAVRVKRVCSDKKEYNKEKRKIYKRMVTRGHRGKDVARQLKKADKKERSQLLQYKSKDNSHEERVHLVLTYTRALPNISKILNKRMEILRKSKKLSNIFKAPPQVSYRRGRNIKDILVHQKWSRTDKKSRKANGQACKCKICSVTYKSGSAKGCENTHVPVNSTVNCKSSNVIYGVHCKKCEKVLYVGETSTKLYTRTQNHLSAIRNKRTDQPVAAHFNSETHSITDFVVVGLEQVWKKDTTYRRLREQYWISRLKTMEPSGINKQQ